MRGLKLLALLACFSLACDETETSSLDTGVVDISLAREASVLDQAQSGDSKAVPDMPVKPLPDKGMTPDKSTVTPDKATATPDVSPAPDAESKVDQASGDSGACMKNGQSCLVNACCKGLKCCTGMPVPPGKATCYTHCPVSDRALKYGVRPLSSAEVLGRLSKLPISTWTYNNEPPGVRHIGPMAQDFNAAFGVGADPRFISPVDADGVALVALQELNRQLKQLRAELEKLKKENRSLRKEVQQLKVR
jgi:hypothetical protein